MPEQTAIQKINTYLESETVKSRFSEVIGSERNAGAYIASVMLAVANDESGHLKECAPSSIYVSALRAATLRLSVDPSTGQAYLVPFKNKATLIVGYKGLYDMAVRTNRYRFINVSPLYEGEEIEIDRITGKAVLKGGKISNKRAGWVGSFEMMNGFGKVIYMTVDEIHEHAKQYSRNYSSDKSIWKTNPKEMERKTILRLLLRKWGYLDPSDVSTLETVEQEADVDAELVPGEEVIDEKMAETQQETKKSESQILAELGYPVEEKANQETLI